MHMYLATHSCGVRIFGKAYSIHRKVCGCCGTEKKGMHE